MMHTLYHPHRHWNTATATMPRLDHQDAATDQEDSLSARYGFLLGQDVGRCRLKTTGEFPSEDMARGYREGMRQHAHQTDGYVRKVIGLRVSAFARGLPVSSAITAEFLRSIDVPVCPVSGVVLTKSTQQSTDWSVERLDNSLGYVPGNVCILAQRVNRLKGSMTLDELLGLAAYTAHKHVGHIDAHDDDELSATEALRLAALAAGPAGWSNGRFSDLPPLAAAPGVWGTHVTNVAIVHVESARSRVEGSADRLRRQWFRELGGQAWRMSNRLVQNLTLAFESGRHPCDAWFDIEISQGLRGLMQALADQAKGKDEAVRLEALKQVRSSMQPISRYHRTGSTGDEATASSAAS